MHLCYQTKSLVKELMQYAVKDEQQVLIIWQILTFGLDNSPRFPFQQHHKRIKWALPLSPITDLRPHSQPQTSSTAARAAPPQQLSTQAFRCFRYSSSVICLALYKDTLIPTVAIVMAMGSMPLLCDCICTSPETCLCGENAFKAPHAALFATHICVVQKRFSNLWVNNLLFRLVWVCSLRYFSMQFCNRCKYLMQISHQEFAGFKALIHCESLWSTCSKRKYPGVSLPNLMIISACRVFPTNHRTCKGKKKRSKLS